MELLDALSQTFDHATKIVAGVGPDQFGMPTPCTEWDVKALVTHTVAVVANMGRGASGADLLPDMNAFALESDLAAQFRSEADRTLAAWTTRGLDGDVNVGAGPMPVAAGLAINFLDTATHTWDIATATGQDANLPDELASTALAMAQGLITDEIRAFAGFDPAVVLGPDATPTEELVAFLGRRP